MTASNPPQRDSLPWRTARAGWRGLALASLVSLASGGAQADGAQPLAIRSLAGSCAQCHGTAGQAVAGSAVPGLAGIPAAEFIERMKALRSGDRPATVMQQIARGYTDAQVDALAAYFAAVPNARPRTAAAEMSAP